MEDDKYLNGRIDELEAENEELKKQKQQVEIKLKLMKELYEKEVSSFNETRVDRIFENSGAMEYIERLKDRNKTKADAIKNLEKELEYKNKEIAVLKDKCREFQKRGSNYLRELKDVQGRKDPLDVMDEILHRGPTSIDSNPYNNFSLNSTVPAPPPPPPQAIEVPLDEILRP